MATAMGKYQARYSTIAGPCLMGDGNPMTEELRSLVLVSKREENSNEDGRKTFEATSRQLLKVFIVSQVLPEGTSLTRLDLPWVKTLFSLSKEDER